MAKSLKLTETERHLRNLLGMDGKVKDSTYVELGDMSSQKPKMKVFFVDLTHLPRITQFFVLSMATFVFYLVYGYLQVGNFFCNIVKLIEYIHN